MRHERQQPSLPTASRASDCGVVRAIPHLPAAKQRQLGAIGRIIRATADVERVLSTAGIRVVTARPLIAVPISGPPSASPRRSVPRLSRPRACAQQSGIGIPRPVIHFFPGGLQDRLDSSFCEAQIGSGGHCHDTRAT
jgi:hypothetical protein